MKTLHLSIIAIMILLLVPAMMNDPVKAGCMISSNSDWPSAPCYGCPGCIPSKEKQREEWNPYYQYKGASWMEMMKTQMIEAMKNGTLEDWVTGNDSNYDAWRYYYLNDQAPFFRSSVSGLNDEHPYFPPPLQQLTTGIAPKDVACKEGLELIIKTADGLPACVRYPTANVLIERGWAKESVSTMTSPATTIIIPVNSSIRSNGFTFIPSLVKVVIGTNNTVRWINMDSVTNDITSGFVSFRSGAIESGYAWTHTFDKSGMYHYYSDIHPWLKGTVIVSQISENTTRINPVIDVISISGTNSPPNPGGPEIQLQLMNIGMKSVTNLNATLVLNNNYVFNFKDVTESNPLAPSHSASDTEILIGAGYTTEMIYPLIVAGIVNNEPFNYTLNIHIPYTNENGITNTKTNPLGITALIIYHPPLGCLGTGCPPNTLYLKINSNSTAYLLGYNICDDNSCAKNNNLSILLPINTPLYPNYQSIGLPVNLQWKYGDTVNIQLEVSPNADNKTASLLDLGNSTIVP